MDLPQSTNPLADIKLDEMDVLKSENLHLKLTAIARERQSLIQQLQQLDVKGAALNSELIDFVAKVKRKYGVTQEQLTQAVMSMGQDASSLPAILQP